MTIHNTLHKPPALGGKEDAAMQKAGGGLVGSGWVVVFFGWGWGGVGEGGWSPDLLTFLPRVRVVSSNW